ncbi:MAG TPA: hypothetical protein VG755_11500 [Nannocystaceae bacterium]|nr:hypothetical protein [Nannocystaceae bacterium]
MIRAPHLLCFVALTTACPASDDDDPVADDAGDSSSAAGDSSSAADESSSSGGSPDIDALFECEDMIMDARPLAGPGYDPAMGLMEPLQDTYIVSTTQILPKPEEQARFFELVGEVTMDLDQRDGMIAYALGFEPNCGFARTITVWRDAAAMVAFASGDVHTNAASQAFDVGVAGRVTHFAVSADEMPVTWDVAAAHLAEIAPY